MAANKGIVQSSGNCPVLYIVHEYDRKLLFLLSIIVRQFTDNSLNDPFKYRL